MKKPLSKRCESCFYSIKLLFTSLYSWLDVANHNSIHNVGIKGNNAGWKYGANEPQRKFLSICWVMLICRPREILHNKDLVSKELMTQEIQAHESSFASITENRIIFKRLHDQHVIERLTIKVLFGACKEVEGSYKIGTTETYLQVRPLHLPPCWHQNLQKMGSKSYCQGKEIPRP